MEQGKILIIDDDARNIYALSAVLRSRRLHCFAASGIMVALELMRNGDIPDIILMDIMMPDIDGYEGIALIKAYPAYAAIPIIAVTAQAMTGDREKCLAAGAAGYISKPVDVDELLHLIRELK
ncbi:response regulator [Flavihumibacter petaseus]|uniref:Putative two-component response regulator n=1 Tax=Flavihumibacter petaseus NBRC 106054 TaxID=1220578 RepID=A0A0E9MVY1_9BACT|nr:response regulator [Flavihumibacter petaseus]GAO41877.1 putative two-component response regulator [Flavihumibacter petaseus NBRC 106054]